MNKRKTWFKIVKTILKIFTKKPKFIFLKEVPSEPSLHLCNHVGSKGPLRLELYYKHNFRFWGTHEMNEGAKSTYKYLSTIYFQGKKHMKPVFAKIVAFVATPFLNLIYLGLNLIPTYSDMRLKNTFRESLKCVENNQSIIIFPENSTNGYFDELIEFNRGFVSFLDKAYNKGIDLPIFLMYFQKKHNRYIVDKKILYSEVLNMKKTSEEIAEMFRIRCNELGKM